MSPKSEPGQTTPAEKKKTRPILQRILLAVLLIIAALTVIFTVYAQDYYHADEAAAAAIRNPPDTVTLSVSRDKITFIPAGAEDTGDAVGLIFYPGGKVEYTAYAPLCEKLAGRGITCILMKMPFHLAILDINAADSVNTADYPIDHWYIGGHSLGGVAASMYLKNHSDEYDGLLLLGAYSSSDLSGTGLSVLSVYGENDGVLNRDQYEKCRSNLPGDSSELVIPGGCHAWFGSYGRQKGDGEASITADKQQEITADAVSAWIKQ